jgi:hypothetical protein
MIAEDIAKYFCKKYNRAVDVEVSEDGENSASVLVIPTFEED